MPAGFGFFCTEGWAKAIDFLECRTSSLNVELASLREVRCVIEIVRLEEGASVLTNCPGENGCINPDKLPGVEEIVNRLGNFSSNPKNRPLLS